MKVLAVIVYTILSKWIEFSVIVFTVGILILLAAHPDVWDKPLNSIQNGCEVNSKY